MNEARQRIDKWLVYARIVKTRSQAVDLVEGGRVRVNRERVQKASYPVDLNDVLTISVHGRIKVLQVIGTGLRRGSPDEARLLYVDMAASDASPAEDEQAAEGEE